MIDFRKMFVGRPRAAEADSVAIRQSDWTAVGSSAIKRWGITGVLDTGAELHVAIDVSFTRSNISGHVEPHVFIFLQPNTLGNPAGFVTLQIAKQEEKVDAPIMTATIGLTDDGSVIVSPMDRSGAGYIVHNVLSSGENFRILMIADPKEVIFHAILPNNSNALSDITATLPLYDHNRSPLGGSHSSQSRKPTIGTPNSHARPAKELPFQINELIIYPDQGVGRIVAIEEQEIAGIKLEFYVVDFERKKLRLKVPTSKAEQKGMRKFSEKP
jgi:hypothetical protein